MTAQLSSFSEGLPVTISHWDKTVLIARSRIRFHYRGLCSLFRRDRELPISEFKAVEIVREVYDWTDDPWDSRISITLVHGFNRRNEVILARQRFDYYPVAEERIKPLQKLWVDAARVLSLPAFDAGEKLLLGSNRQRAGLN